MRASRLGIQPRHRRFVAKLARCAADVEYGNIDLRFRRKGFRFAQHRLVALEQRSQSSCRRRGRRHAVFHHRRHPCQCHRLQRRIIGNAAPVGTPAGGSDRRRWRGHGRCGPRFRGDRARGKAAKGRLDDDDRGVRPHRSRPVVALFGGERGPQGLHGPLSAGPAAFSPPGRGQFPRSLAGKSTCPDHRHLVGSAARYLHPEAWAAAEKPGTGAGPYTRPA